MKSIGITLIIIVIFFGAAYLLTGGPAGAIQAPVTADNVSIVDGVQIVEITAKGGYQPRSSVAKAGLPTVIRFNTSGTFDCSTALRIPSLGISRTLARNGNTDVDIGTSKAETLKGSCSMGMYRFEIDFQG